MSKPTDEWYTPVDFLERVRDYFGAGIAFDPTCSPSSPAWDYAQAKFTIEDDALTSEWPEMRRVFFQPPYSKPAEFVSKLVEHSYRVGHRGVGTVPVALALMNASTSTRWAQELLREGSFACFASPRIRFYRAREADEAIFVRFAPEAGYRLELRKIAGEHGFASFVEFARAKPHRSPAASDLAKALAAEDALETIYVASDGTELVQPPSPRYENLIVGFEGGFADFVRAFEDLGHCVRLRV